MAQKPSPMNAMTPPPLPTNPNGDEKIWIILCHLSLFLGAGLILPLIVYLIKKQDAPLTAAHAREALNFHLSLVIYMICAFMLIFALTFVLIGFLLIPLIPAIGIAAAVCSIIACIKASEGGFYYYPLTIRFV